MIFTFPGFGSLRYIVPKIMNDLDIQYIEPEDGGEILMRGAALSPEEMCLPFKYMMGSLAAAYEKGADTVIMVSGSGPCRLGEYVELMAELMKNEGYEYQWIVLEPPSDIGLTEFMRRLNVVFNSRYSGSTLSVIRTIAEGLRVMYRFEKTERNLLKKAGYLEDPQEAVRIMNKLEGEIRAENSLPGCRRILARIRKEASRLNILKDNPVKVMVTGEIYTTAESAVNRDIEKYLASEGCSVLRCVDVTWWIRRMVNRFIGELMPMKILHHMKRKKSGMQGISCDIGGYGRETVDMLLSSAKNADGAVKLMPAGCMPEIVAKSYCEKHQDEAGIRVLNLIYDEMSGNAGCETRIEAFVDMLERRKNVLAGD